ncbi:AAA family ATPase, partial [Streptomyces sp. NPDC051173]|uniref:AAA family ATPase n=1 Tax=Streptomyces sp. NPDC051173 TaxID=3155164 RepID=UPI00345083FE
AGSSPLCKDGSPEASARAGGECGGLGRASAGYGLRDADFSCERWALHATGLLARGFEVTIDATSTTARERSNWLAIATAHQAPAIAVIVRTPPETARERNAARERPVPTDVVDAMATRVTALTVDDLLDEGFAHVTEHTTAAQEEPRRA